MILMALLRRIGNIALRIAGVVFVLALSGAVYVVWPRRFVRTYLAQASAPLEKGDRLAALAEKRCFRMGSAVHATELKAFRETAGGDFNSITPANALKWGNLLVDGRLGSYDFRQADELIDEALALGVRVRGHTLIWGRFPGSGHPSDLEKAVSSAPDPKARLHQILAEHIGSVLGHFRGRISQWDVVNEPLDFYRPTWDKNVFYRTLGADFVGDAFRLAHEADPSLELVLNEELQRYDDDQAEKFFDIVRNLVQGGVPIHGVGLQSHLLLTIPEVASLRAFASRIAKLGLFVEITELDARLRLFGNDPDPYAAQGRYLEALAGACLDIAACRGITVWGISDRHTWLNELPPFMWIRPNAPLLFDECMRRKPAYFGIRQALLSHIGIGAGTGTGECHPRLRTGSE